MLTTLPLPFIVGPPPPGPTWRRAARGMSAVLLSLAALGLATGARAGLITAGPLLTQQPAALVDPLGTLSLGASQFLVPVLAQGLSDMDQWQFSLQFDTTVAAPADNGGLFQSVYQADFGNGVISQITGSGLALGGLLLDVSGWFAPSVSGDGVLAYVLFEYQPSREGQDPRVSVPDTPPAGVPEPSTPALVMAALGLAAWSWRRRRSTPSHVTTCLERV